MNLLGLVCGQHEDSLAISAPDGTATYGQLVARAAQLAQAYQALGVEAGDRVGVVLAPGRDALAASLAAWILRAAYVPIDPTQPAARAVGILKRCGPKVCVGFPAPGWEELDLRTPRSLAGEWPSPGVVPPEITAGSADDVAYVIHTSGSTGVSKGIEIEHHGVHQLILDVDERVPVDGRVIGSWWCSPDFDVSVWESWSILCTGGELVIPSPADRAEAARFAAFLDESNVTNAYAPHGYLPALLDLFRRDPGACRTMRRLMVGIEPIALGLLQDLLRERPDLSVINGYGPAEATVLCCLYVVPRTGGDPADRTPIGTATRGITFSFIDEELVISGEGVGRGYLNGTPEQLARFTITPETRSYRTGDRVKVLPDGNLLFLGRIDFQMKVRGYRIEPGEIETAIRALGTVSEVVVGQREVPGVGDAVVAYVVPVADFDPHRTRAALRDVLPAYALPSAFVVVDEIPMTAKNGKVNRKALAELPLPAQATGPDTGDLIVDAWRAELGVEIPPDLGFVDLGGSSLPAVRVAHTLREATGKDISAADVLAARSPAELAGVLANAFNATDGPVAEGRRSGPLSPNQLGLWMHDQITQGTRAYPLPHCFVLPDPDPGRVADALSRAIAAHPIFGATTRRTADGVELVLDQHEIGLRVEDGPIDRVLDEPFTLEGGELMRCVLSGDRLLLVWHHLVVDGWSVRVFLDDLGRCFDDPAYRPVAPRLTPCDVNAWLHAQAQQQTERLVQTATELSAVGDFPDRFPAQDKAELRPLALGRDLTKRLRAKARAEGLLPYSYMCAAYQDALRTVLGVERFLLGCVVAGRNLPELRRVSGWYVNTELVVSTSGTVRSTEQTLTRTHVDQDGLPIALLAYHLRTKGVKAPQFIFSVDEEYTLTIQGKPCEKVQLWSPRAIRDTNLVLLTGPDDVYGYFEHRLAFLSIDEAATLVETFLARLEDLVGG